MKICLKQNNKKVESLIMLQIVFIHEEELLSR